MPAFMVPLGEGAAARGPLAPLAALFLLGAAIGLSAPAFARPGAILVVPPRGRRGLIRRGRDGRAETLPAHATLFTGLLPPRHGLRINSESGWNPAMRCWPKWRAAWDWILPSDIVVPTCTASTNCTFPGAMAGCRPRGCIYTGTGPDRAYRIRVSTPCNLAITGTPTAPDWELVLAVYWSQCSSSLADCVCVDDESLEGEPESVVLNAVTDYFIVIDGCLGPPAHHRRHRTSARSTCR